MTDKEQLDTELDIQLKDGSWTTLGDILTSSNKRLLQRVEELIGEDEDWDTDLAHSKKMAILTRSEFRVELRTKLAVLEKEHE